MAVIMSKFLEELEVRERYERMREEILVFLEGATAAA